MTRRLTMVSGLALALALLLAVTASAQLQTGNLYGTVKDQSGSALPGVTVTLSGQGAPQIQVTNAQGQFHFLGLSPGATTSRRSWKASPPSTTRTSSSTSRATPRSR